MTTTVIRQTRARGIARFTLHYVEMSVAMVLGMILLAPGWAYLWPGVDAVFEIGLLVMATNMAIGMAVPMALRRHSWRHIVEMAASMYVAFLVLLVPYWLGLIDAMTVSHVGHGLMFVLMLGVMLARRAGYQH